MEQHSCVLVVRTGNDRHHIAGVESIFKLHNYEPEAHRYCLKLSRGQSIKDISRIEKRVKKNRVRAFNARCPFLSTQILWIVHSCSDPWSKDATTFVRSKVFEPLKIFVILNESDLYPYQKRMKCREEILRAVGDRVVVFMTTMNLRCSQTGECHFADLLREEEIYLVDDKPEPCKGNCAAGKGNFAAGKWTSQILETGRRPQWTRTICVDRDNYREHYQQTTYTLGFRALMNASGGLPDTKAELNQTAWSKLVVTMGNVSLVPLPRILVTGHCDRACETLAEISRKSGLGVMSKPNLIKFSKEGIEVCWVALNSPPENSQGSWQDDVQDAENFISNLHEKIGNDIPICAFVLGNQSTKGSQTEKFYKKICDIVKNLDYGTHCHIVLDDRVRIIQDPDSIEFKLDEKVPLPIRNGRPRLLLVDVTNNGSGEIVENALKSVGALSYYSPELIQNLNLTPELLSKQVLKLNEAAAKKNRPNDLVHECWFIVTYNDAWEGNWTELVVALPDVPLSVVVDGIDGFTSSYKSIYTMILQNLCLPKLHNVWPICSSFSNWNELSKSGKSPWQPPEDFAQFFFKCQLCGHGLKWMSTPKPIAEVADLQTKHPLKRLLYCEDCDVVFGCTSIGISEDLDILLSSDNNQAERLPRNDIPQTLTNLVKHPSTLAFSKSTSRLHALSFATLHNSNVSAVTGPLPEPYLTVPRILLVSGDTSSGSLDLAEHLRLKSHMEYAGWGVYGLPKCEKITEGAELIIPPCDAKVSDVADGLCKVFKSGVDSLGNCCFIQACWYFVDASYNRWSQENTDAILHELPDVPVIVILDDRGTAVGSGSETLRNFEENLFEAIQHVKYRGCVHLKQDFDGHKDLFKMTASQLEKISLGARSRKACLKFALFDQRILERKHREDLYKTKCQQSANVTKANLTFFSSKETEHPSTGQNFVVIPSDRKVNSSYTAYIVFPVLQTLQHDESGRKKWLPKVSGNYQVEVLVTRKTMKYGKAVVAGSIKTACAAGLVSSAAASGGALPILAATLYLTSYMGSVAELTGYTMSGKVKFGAQVLSIASMCVAPVAMFSEVLEASGTALDIASACAETTEVNIATGFEPVPEGAQESQSFPRPNGSNTLSNFSAQQGKAGNQGRLAKTVFKVTLYRGATLEQYLEDSLQDVENDHNWVGKFLQNYEISVKKHDEEVYLVAGKGTHPL